MKRSLLTIFALLGMLLTLASPAYASDDPGDVGAASASTCSDAPGPGDWDTACTYVDGSGLWVNFVDVKLTSTVAPYFPATVCNLKGEIWGITLYPEAHWRTEHTLSNCGKGNQTIRFTVNRTFKDNTYLCGRTTVSEGASQPMCILIRR